VLLVVGSNSTATHWAYFTRWLLVTHLSMQLSRLVAVPELRMLLPPQESEQERNHGDPSTPMYSACAIYGQVVGKGNLTVWVEVITVIMFVTFNVVVFSPPVAVKTVASVMVSVETYCVGTLSQLTLTGMF